MLGWSADACPMLSCRGSWRTTVLWGDGREVATVLHIITGLGDGGAEAVLGRLVTCDGTSRHEVVSLTDRGVHGDKLMVAGIPVHTLDMRRGRVTVAGLVKLFRLLRAVNPDIVQTWMYHADLIGGLLARLAGRHAVVWGIRNAYPGARGNTMSTRLVARACALASHVVPQRVVSCSTAGADAHIKYGYRASRMVVIPNGYDLATFAPDPAARRRLRTEFQASEGVVLLGMVARWDPHKDHANLIAALAQLQAGAPGAWRCVLVGEDITRDNRRLVSMLARYGVQDRVLLLGPRRDVPGIMNALDIHLLSSVGEAFPNVVAEAMACYMEIGRASCRERV